MTDYAIYPSLQAAVQDGVAVVRIPEVGSSGRLQAAVHRDISLIWRTLDDDPDVRAIVVTGAGEVFYHSGDPGGIRPITRLDKHQTFNVLQRMAGEGAGIITNLINCDKPVISAINGRAAGGGLAIAVMADIAIAAENATLLDPHILFGVATGDHAVQAWPLLCSLAKAKRYLLLAESIDAREAERIGLVSLVVPPDKLMPTALRVARQLADGPQYALRFTKRALNQWFRLGGIVAGDYSQVLELLNFFGSEFDAAMARWEQEQK